MAQAVESANMDFITVHGRHWKERYDVAARFDEIAQFVKMVDIPVIANGDADSWCNVKRILEETGAAGVMISRAGLGRPWLFAEIVAASKQESFDVPGVTMRQALFIEHVAGLVELDGEFSALLQARKLSGYYQLDVPGLKSGQISGFQQLRDLIGA